MGASSTNVERGAEILLELGKEQHEGMTLADLAEALNDTKPAVHRALAGLSKYGFVQQASRRGRYTLGPALYALAMKPRSTRQVTDLLRPGLIRCSKATGATTYLLARAGLDAVCLDIEEGHFALPTSVVGVGGRNPLGFGAASWCILAALDEKSRRVILDANEERIKARISLESVYDGIEHFNQNGYAMTTVDVQRSVINIAVSVPREIAKTPSAIAVLVPDGHLVEPKRIADLMKEAIGSVDDA
ncbi:DNA-binding IclR family transcriptional regulator [Bradyrhizobium diazoefficiens]|uniref:IclR family transcriptional regulator n=1 Tax=Bradyrhizobium diazoefficiens TaxID=1355477 RepID=UPI0035182C90